MKSVLRKRTQVERPSGPQFPLAFRPSLRRRVPLSFDFKEEADLPGSFSAIEESLESTPDGSMPVHRHERDYLTCATMSTPNLTRLI